MEITLFTPYDRQLEIIDQFANSEHKFGVAACARQVGKSLLGQNLMLYWLLKDQGSKGAIISPIYNQSKKIFNELTTASRDIIKASNKADLTVEFINGSTLQFLGAERFDSIRGFSFHYMFIDEAAFIKPEAINEAILPTLTAIGKKCFIASTPKQKSNWFYKYYLNGLGDNPNYISFQWSSFESPYVDDEFLKEQERSLPEGIFRQEYYGEFTDSASDVFTGLSNVCILRKWEPSNERCFVGIDVGLSDDYTAVCLQTESGRVLFMDRFNGESLTIISQKVSTILNRFNIIGGYVEINGLGRGLYDMLSQKYRKLKPWTTSQDNKTQMVRKLIEDIDQQVVELPHEDLFAPLYRELGMFTYKMSANGKMSFGHPSGHKDDTVDSLLLSNEARHTIKSRSIYVGNTGGDLSPSFGRQVR